MRFVLFVATAVLGLTGGCAPDDPMSSELDGEGTDTGAPLYRLSLIDHARWQPSTASDDPVADHRPATVDCEGGWYRELDGIEVDTSACNYLSLHQPLAVPLDEGDPIRLRMWWATLASVEPAQAHLAVFIDDTPIWEHHVPIPSDAESITAEFPSPIDADVGQPLTFHLHNHGYNTWNFFDLTVQRAAP